jgi:hypothetical protein
MLIVDAANVVGSRPDGWWRDRAGAAARLCEQLSRGIATGTLETPVVAILEGSARDGMPEQERAGLRIVHADGSGDDSIVAAAGDAVSNGHQVTVVTADRGLRQRLEQAGSIVVGPRWLLERI